MVETTSQIERHLSANMNVRKKDIIIGNFLGGLAWGFGTVMGASVVVAVLGALLNFLGVFTAISNVFSQINAINQLPQVPNLSR